MQHKHSKKEYNTLERRLKRPEKYRAAMLLPTLDDHLRTMISSHCEYNVCASNAHSIFTLKYTILFPPPSPMYIFKAFHPIRCLIPGSACCLPSCCWRASPATRATSPWRPPAGPTVAHPASSAVQFPIRTCQY